MFAPVELEYKPYVCDESVWLHSGVLPPMPEWGAWQYRHAADEVPLTGEGLFGDRL